jgi:hypothetical protein
MPKYDCCADGAKHQRAEGLFRSYNACPYTCPWPMYDRPNLERHISNADAQVVGPAAQICRSQKSARLGMPRRPV